MRRCSKLLILLAGLLAASAGAAGAVTQEKQEDPLKNPGFVYFYNNQYDQALRYFEMQVTVHPDDAEQYNHVAQAILYREMFRNGALESQLVSGTNPFLRRARLSIDPADQARFDACVSRALNISSDALQKDDKNVGALYALGVAHALRANYLFLVQKAWMESLRESTAARKANERILEIDPDFVDARLLLGLHKYIVGCLPFYMRALGFLSGFHGDKEGGIRDLELVRTKGKVDRYDAAILLAAIYRRERRPREAIPLLKESAAIFPGNYLLRFEQVQMYSDLGDKPAALNVLREIDGLRAAGAQGYVDLPPEKIDYLRGNLLFWYGDLDPALACLERVTRKADTLELGLGVMAWLRLGQVYDLRGDHSRAVQAYRSAMQMAPQSEPASEAKGYLANPYKRKKASG